MKSVVNAKDIYGDTLDYLSHGAMEIMQREIWDRYPQAMASHDMTRKMQGKVIDPTPREEREKSCRISGPQYRLCLPDSEKQGLLRRAAQ